MPIISGRSCRYEKNSAIGINGIRRRIEYQRISNIETLTRTDPFLIIYLTIILLDIFLHDRSFPSPKHDGSVIKR
jgi:hypothetical protein